MGQNILVDSLHNRVCSTRLESGKQPDHRTYIERNDMTAVLDHDTSAETTPEGETDEQKKARERDFSKFTEKHQELADFVNADSDFQKAELTNVTANQVKAILALRTDWGNSPEQAEARAARKAAKEEEAKQYEGLNPEQIKLLKQAKTAEAQEAKLQKRIDEAKDKAAKFRAAANGSGEDLAAIVAEQEAAAEKPKRGRAKVSA